MERKEKIEREIANLEKKLQKDHFGGIVDHAARKRDEKRLAKLRKELESLTGKDSKK